MPPTIVKSSREMQLVSVGGFAIRVKKDFSPPARIGAHVEVLGWQKLQI